MISRGTFTNYDLAKAIGIKIGQKIKINDKEYVLKKDYTLSGKYPLTYIIGKTYSMNIEETKPKMDELNYEELCRELRKEIKIITNCYNKKLNDITENMINILEKETQEEFSPFLEIKCYATSGRKSFDLEKKNIKKRIERWKNAK